MNYYVIGDDKSLKTIQDALALLEQIQLSGEMAQITYRPEAGINLYSMIRFIEGNNDGHGISIGGGGIAILGSGESARLLQPAAGSADTEKTIIASDQAIEFWVHCQGGVDNAKKVTLSTSGQLSGHQKAITSGTAAPSGGSNGDIYIQY